MSHPLTRGEIVERILMDSLRALKRGFPEINRERPIIWGVTAKGTFVEGMTLDMFMARATELLRESGRVYRWRDTLVFEFHTPDRSRLDLIAAQGKPEPHAAAMLNNLFGVGVQSEEKTCQSPVPSNLASVVLLDEGLWGTLPAIQTYAHRAVFDLNFNLCGPGWHPEQGILVHGPDISPAEVSPVAPNSLRSVDRLPPYLKRLLKDFCWASDADLENFLALLLSGVLSNHFDTMPKPMGLIDGNQQDIGKTLLCEVIGVILDGQSPERIPLVGDEELEKKIGAKLRESQSSIFFFDNAKTKIDSAFLEANALSPLLSVRLLGHSRNINRPNTYLWLVTSNLTSGSSDVITRGIPVRLRYEGNPLDRSFGEDLMTYATQHRLDILGELAGMIQHWTQAGRLTAADIWPPDRPAPRHRCRPWAQLVGGILGSNGYFAFLSNVDEARAAMDEGLQSLAALAEHLVATNPPGYLNPPQNDPQRGKLPREWVALFSSAGAFEDKLATKKNKGRETWVGTYLSGKIDRPVPICIGTSSGTATLKKNSVRSDQKRYYFEVVSSTSVADTAAALEGPCARGPAQNPCGPGVSPTSSVGEIKPEGTNNLEGTSGGNDPVEPPCTSGAGNDLEWI
jgi:hypothetical protein